MSSHMHLSASSSPDVGEDSTSNPTNARSLMPSSADYRDGDDDDDDQDMEYAPAAAVQLEDEDDYDEDDENDDDDDDGSESSFEDEENEEDEEDGEFNFTLGDEEQEQLGILRPAGLLDEDGNEITEQAEGRTLYLSPEQLLRVFGVVGFGHRLRGALAGGRRGRALADDDADNDQHSSRSARRARRRPPSLEPNPNPKGEELMESGTFGVSERRNAKMLKAKRVARRVLERELGGTNYGRERAEMPLLKQGLIPQSKADLIIQYDQPCYSGQFSTDGNFFFCCSKDMKVRMYDTSNPYQWKYYKTVSAATEGWAITDASLSTDNRFLAYCSMTHKVCLASTDPLGGSHPRVLDLHRTSQNIGHDSNLYCSIFSVRFSGDGREVVAGSGRDHTASVFVYDIERDETILRIPAHTDDVNAVCFGDIKSPHILYSGSDDCTVKVWDRRSMAGGRAAGVLLGHTEGVTFVDSKGDGRYILSNGKDQTAKLWDLRHVISPEVAKRIPTHKWSQGWDYRYGGYDMSGWKKHPHDCSLVTYRGHCVERTLIRCHFSPEGSTDGRYVYSGSHDGKVYIWNMDATLKDTIEVAKSVASVNQARPRRSRYDDSQWGPGSYRQTVRDCSWHPSIPMIAATSWNGSGWDTKSGTCSVHSWNENGDDDELDSEAALVLDSELRPESIDPPRVRRRRAL